MRLLFASVLMVACAMAATSQRHAYRRAVAGKRAVAGAGASAGFRTLRNRPHEWGRGPVGAVKRFGSSLAQNAAKQSIQFGVAGLRHENLRYQRSNKRGVLPRMGYAAKHTFIVPRTNRRGKKTVAASRIAGNMGAGMISRVWQPASAAGVGAGLASGGIGLGADVGVNMAREFWPRKHRYRSRAKAK
jgi:hypothetical protein